MPGDFGFYMSKANFDALSKLYSPKDLYKERDTVSKYGFASYGVSFSSIPVYVTDLSKEHTMRYQVKSEDGIVVSNHDTEEDAISQAETCAKRFAGRAYYVMKAITKSYVAPAPAITTRL